MHLKWRNRLTCDARNPGSRTLSGQFQSFDIATKIADNLRQINRVRPQEESMKLRIFVTAILGILAILVIGLLGYTGAVVGSKLYFLATERTWHQTEATITTIHTISKPLKYGNHLWAPSWTYTYTVDSRLYSAESTHIAHGFDVNWYQYERVAERDGQLRPVGSTVHAYYDPGDPLHSVLDRATFDIEDAIILSIFILVFAYAVDFVRTGRRRAAKRSP
jgi:hypothetical protein